MVKFLLSALVFWVAFIACFSYLQEWQRARRTPPPVIVPVSTSIETAVKKPAVSPTTAYGAPQNISVSQSGAYVLPVPSTWTVETFVTTRGAIAHTEHNVFNDKGRLVFIIQSPIAEIGYESSNSVDSGFVGTKMEGGASLKKITRVFTEGPAGGFGHYSWDGGNDFWGESFEIFVPFRTGLYARTTEEFQMQAGVPVAYANKTAYDASLSLIEGILGGLHDK